MTKTKTKQNMELVSNEESQRFKKQRMKEVRAAVAHALKHNKRVDEMGFTGTDIPRAMIALQDEVMRARDRHNKATKHISVARRQVQTVFPTVTMLIKRQMHRIMDLSHEVQMRDKVLDDALSHAEMLDAELASARAAIRELR